MSSSQSIFIYGYSESKGRIVQQHYFGLNRQIIFPSKIFLAKCSIAKCFLAKFLGNCFLAKCFLAKYLLANCFFAQFIHHKAFSITKYFLSQNG